MKNCIVVAAHKPYAMPQDPIYLPVQAGRALYPALPGYTGDDTGENISEKNPHYCELTALYWAWKNLPADSIGLAHYRRHFAQPGAKGGKWQRILTGAGLEKLWDSGVQVILPQPRNYFIETNYQQYVHAHHACDLELTRQILQEGWPEYLPAWERVMKRTWGHRFNMFIMQRGPLEAYCSWLFAVLGRLEERLDISGYSAYDARVFGFVSERLLDVWLETAGIRYAELPAMYMEKQNWLRKGGAFLRRKFFPAAK